MNVQRVNEVLSGCVLLTRAWPCQGPIGIAKSCSELAGLPLVSMNVDSVCKYEIYEQYNNVCKN